MADATGPVLTGTPSGSDDGLRALRRESLREVLEDALFAGDDAHVRAGGRLVGAVSGNGI